MLQTILSLAKELISIPSVSTNIQELEKTFAVATRELKDFSFSFFVSNTYPSFLYTNKKIHMKDFKIILNAHLDVVPAKSYQFSPIEKNGKLYGRGAYDMKSATAVMILLFKELSSKVSYPLGLQLVSDEELTSEHGTQYQIEQGLRGKFIISGEGSNLDIVHRAKGQMSIQLTATGKSFHSGYPWLGENAMLKMHKVITAILIAYPPSTKETHDTIVNLISIRTNNIADNKIPDHCTAHIDIRFIHEEADSVLEKIMSLLPSDITMKILAKYPSRHTDPSHAYIKLLQKKGFEVLKKHMSLTKAYGASEVAYFQEVGSDGVELGPIGHGLHSDDEWVDIQSLEDYYYILKKFLLSLS